MTKHSRVAYLSPILFYFFVGKKVGKMSKKKHPDLHIGDIIGRWEIISTAKTRTTDLSISKYWLCRCSCGTIREVSEISLKYNRSLSCGCYNKEVAKQATGKRKHISFYEWCKNNNHEDFLEKWDYDLNKKTPQEISCYSDRFYYFKCGNKDHEYSYIRLKSITSSKNPKIHCKQCSSLAQYLINNFGENALDLLWDYQKNQKSPWDVYHSSKEKIWIKCQKKDYHGSYIIDANSVSKMVGCPYCDSRRVHPFDSFAQYMIDKIGEENFKKMWNKDNNINPFSLPPSTNKEVLLNCIYSENHPPAFIPISRVKANKRYCPYCTQKDKNNIVKEDSLGYLYEKSIQAWSDKNIETPYCYTCGSTEKIWWKCPDGIHEDFERAIVFSVTYDFRCPKCSYNKSVSMLQEAVNEYLTKELKYNVLHENNCSLTPINPKTGFKLFYDNEVESLNLFIEVHGEQHFRITGYTKMTANDRGVTPEEELKYQKWKDLYKKDFVLKNGKNYLEIPYWEYKNQNYKKIIDDKIRDILRETI